MVAVAWKPQGLPEEDWFRANLYGFLGGVLGAAPNENIVRSVRTITGDGTPIGGVLREIAAAAALPVSAIRKEYAVLFIGLTGGQVVPFASYYLNGSLFEKALADLRSDLFRLGIEAGETSADPEDHIAFLFEVMQGLILGAFGEPADLLSQKQFFDAHIGSWADRFFADLEAAPAAAFYRPVARAGSLLLSIERDAFAMA